MEGEADGAHELFERGVVQPGAIRYQQVLPLELEDRLSWSLLLLSLLLLALARLAYRIKKSDFNLVKFTHHQGG